jgi:hypothetical protein
MTFVLGEFNFQSKHFSIQCLFNKIQRKCYNFALYIYRSYRLMQSNDRRLLSAINEAYKIAENAFKRHVAVYFY